MEQEAIMAFIKLAENPDVILKFFDNEWSMPNLKLKVRNEEKFWQTLAECNGFKIQQNTVTKSARILDSNNVRIAWGTINGMEKALDRMLRYSNKYNGDV